MPVGHWKTFSACTAAMRKQGYSAEVAPKVCGKIEAQSKKKKKKGAKRQWQK